MGRMGFVACAALASVMVAATAAASGSTFYMTDATAVIDIDADGRVEAVEVTGVPGAGPTRAVVDRIQQWRFEPVVEGGQAVPARAHADIEVHAVDAGAGRLHLSVGKATFRDPPGMPERDGRDERPRTVVVERVVPSFPGGRWTRGQEANVMLLVEINPAGGVERLGVWHATFVNGLPQRGRALAMEAFVESAKSALQQWQFNPDQRASRQVLVPITYRQWREPGWVKIYPWAEAREDSIVRDIRSRAAAGRAVAHVEAGSDRFVLIDELQPPWM